MSEFAEQVARGTLDDVPLEALRAGLRLPLHDFVGLELVGLRPVVVALDVTDAVRSAGLPLHGGVVATLVDVAANVAAATGGVVDVRRVSLVTGRLELDYVAQPAGPRVLATAEVVEHAKRSVTTRCVVTDGDRELARATVLSRVVPRRGLVTSPDPS